MSREVVGIDPSTNTGLVMLDAETELVNFAQEIHLETGMKSTTSQILDYGRKIVSLIKLDSIVAVEGFAFGAKGQAVSLQYGIGFAIRFALDDFGIEWTEVTPSALKKFVAGKGKGNAKKEIIIKEVYKRWRYEHDSNNVIDAYALCRYLLGE